MESRVWLRPAAGRIMNLAAARRCVTGGVGSTKCSKRRGVSRIAGGEKGEKRKELSFSGSVMAEIGTKWVRSRLTSLFSRHEGGKCNTLTLGLET